MDSINILWFLIGMVAGAVLQFVAFIYILSKS